MHTQRGRDGGESVVFTFILQVSVGDEGGEKKPEKGTMFSLCFSCASGYFCFLLVSINCCSQQEGKGGAWGARTQITCKTDMNWADRQYYQWVGTDCGEAFLSSKKTLNWDWELFPKRSLSAASALNSRHGFNFLNRVLWQTLGGVQPNLFWSVEGTGSKFISQIKRQRHAGCISFVRLRARALAELCWKSPNECHTGLFDIGEKAVNEKGT